MSRLFANASTLFSSPCILPHFHKIDVYFRLIFLRFKKIHHAVYVGSLIVFAKCRYSFNFELRFYKNQALT